MKISRSSWSYKFAYGWSDSYLEQTSLFRFFCRLVLSVFPWAVLFCGKLISIAFVAILFIIGFLFAQQPEILSQNQGKEAFSPYEKWPTIYNHRIRPITLIGIIAAAYLSFEIPGFRWLFSGLTVYIVLNCFLKKKIKESQIWKITRAYILKRCPSIEFTERQ